MNETSGPAGPLFDTATRIATAARLGTGPRIGTALRIGTAERESAISALGEHMAAGRLEVDEYSERVGDASTARTFADLDRLFHDLPAPHPVRTAAAPTAAWAGRRHSSSQRFAWQRLIPASIAARVLIVLLLTVTAPVWIGLLLAFALLNLAVLTVLFHKSYGARQPGRRDGYSQRPW